MVGRSESEAEIEKGKKEKIFYLLLIQNIMKLCSIKNPATVRYNFMWIRKMCLAFLLEEF